MHFDSLRFFEWILNGTDGIVQADLFTYCKDQQQELDYNEHD
jgi:hypothetical protein